MSRGVIPPLETGAETRDSHPFEIALRVPRYLAESLQAA